MGGLRTSLQQRTQAHGGYFHLVSFGRGLQLLGFGGLPWPVRGRIDTEKADATRKTWFAKGPLSQKWVRAHRGARSFPNSIREFSTSGPR